MAEKIRGVGNEVKIKVQDKEGGAPFLTTSNLSGGKIRIRADGTTWQDSYLGKYEVAIASGAEDDEFCIVADLAATLLHELLHTCLAGAGSSFESSESCKMSYMIENGFRWALAQRFPCLTSTDDCFYYDDPRLWLNDGTSYPGSPPWE